MKQWGTVALMLFAFVVGVVSTYNCGGGSSAEAAGDADTLQGHPATDFALSSHEHDAGDITSGVLDLSLLPAHTHPQYALTSHTHPEYALSNHTHDEYMLSVDTCSNGQVLKWNGSVWVCAEDIDTTNTDADTLDGLNSTDFALSDHSHAGLTSGYVSVSFQSGFDRSGLIQIEENLWTIDEQEQFANADTSVCWEGVIFSSMDTAEEKIWVPVQLPDGATITGFQIVYYDERDDGFGVRAQLRRNISFGKDFPFASITSTGISYMPQYAYTTSIDPDFAVVDNSLYSYGIRGKLYGGTDTVLISAMVKYEFP